MEKFLNPFDMEYMKMAILKHEEMFREQVFELHRLYHNQKMLMNNISSTTGSKQNDQDRWFKSRNGNSFDGSNYSNDQNQKPRQRLALEPPVEEQNAELNGNVGVEMDEEDEIELTLGLSSYYHTKKTEAPLNSDSALSLSSSSLDSNRIKSKNSTTQRLSADRRNEELTPKKWGFVEVPNTTSSSFLSGRRNSNVSDKDEQLTQDRLQQSPWLFQVLSLNMT